MLQDGFQREFQYLRLSVTDTCNFRCTYCLPNGYRKTDADAPLTGEEIRRLVRAFARMGFWKVRLTGGEPTLRRDIVELARTVASTDGIRQVALSTNGYRLAALAQPLVEAGVSRFNVSIDSLDRARFAEMTGQDRLEEVLAGTRAVLALGAQLKINAVWMRRTLERDLDGFLAWLRETPAAVRFIELMRTGENGALFGVEHVSSSELQARLLRDGWRRQERAAGSGPAVEFTHADYAGRVGIIAPYGPDFCTTCNRLRVSSRGDLRLCLFGEGGYALREWLQHDSQADELVARVHAVLGEKKVSHFLQEGNYGSTRNFAGIGG
jgi:cyclic pyranopterin phosphate synthase